MPTGREIALEQALIALFDVATRGTHHGEDLIKDTFKFLDSGHHRLNEPDIELIKRELSSAFANGNLG